MSVIHDSHTALFILEVVKFEFVKHTFQWFRYAQINGTLKGARFTDATPAWKGWICVFRKDKKETGKLMPKISFQVITRSIE